MLQLTTPLTDEDVARLQAGDRVELSGVIYTARDAAHARLVELIEQGQQLPIPLSGQVIYYVGPAPAKPGQVIGSAGPTTSYRMDQFTIPLLQQGLKAMIGKGNRSPEVKQGLQKYTAAYFGAVGGAAALIARSIIKAEVVAYPELGPEAVRRLEVESLPLFVVNDSRGQDLYQIGQKKYRNLLMR